MTSQQEGKGIIEGEVLCSLVDEDKHPIIANPFHPPDQNASLLSKNLWLPLRDQEMATGLSPFFLFIFFIIININNIIN